VLDRRHILRLGKQNGYRVRADGSKSSKFSAPHRTCTPDNRNHRGGQAALRPMRSFPDWRLSRLKRHRGERMKVICRVAVEDPALWSSQS